MVVYTPQSQSPQQLCEGTNLILMPTPAGLVRLSVVAAVDGQVRGSHCLDSGSLGAPLLCVSPLLSLLSSPNYDG